MKLGNRTSAIEVEELKCLIKEIDANSQQLKDISLNIHDNPELGFHEEKVALWLTQCLEDQSFYTEQGICELPAV